LITTTTERNSDKLLIETLIRKHLALKAHWVAKVEEAGEQLIIHINRLGTRLLRCGICRQRCRHLHSIRKELQWRDLSLRKTMLLLR
jgi:hypothetical protein